MNKTNIKKGLSRIPDEGILVKFYTAAGIIAIIVVLLLCGKNVDDMAYRSVDESTLVDQYADLNDGGSLEHITAINEHDKVVLKWSTPVVGEDETFSIERSNEGVNFDKIANVSCTIDKNRSSYSFTDEYPAQHSVYYRILHLNNDEILEKSEIVKVSPGRNTTQVSALHEAQVSPNPAMSNNKLEVKLQLPETGEVILQILSINGHEIYHECIQGEKGENKMDVTLSGFIPDAYIVRTTYQGRMENNRVIVL